MNTDQIRDRLAQRAEALGLRHEALSRHVHHLDDRERDDAEAATWRGADEVWEALDDATIESRDAVLSALRRLDDGTYGFCIRCGDEIAQGRLVAMPEAALCASCARDLEEA